MNSRRKFLSTSGATAGGLLLAPILSQIKAQAAGTKLPPRFVFLVEGNGLEPPHVTPIGYKRPNVHVGKPKVPNMQGVTEMVDESLVGKELPESLHPIQAWQDRLTVVNGLSGRIAGGGHSNDFGALGADIYAVLLDLTVYDDGQLVSAAVSLLLRQPQLLRAGSEFHS